MTIKVETYDPKREQFNAQVQGIYESLVKRHLGLASTAKFKVRNKRLDIKHNLPQYVVNDLVSTAFAIATKVGQKHGYLKKGTNAPTLHGKAKAAKRAGYDEAKIVAGLQMEGLDHGTIMYVLRELPETSKEYNWQNVLDYEMTLALRRKTQYHRILKIKKNKKWVYFVMPEGVEFKTLKEAKEGAEDMQPKKTRSKARRVANPSTNKRLPKQSPKLKGTVVVCYETRRCNLTESQLKKTKSLTGLYKQTDELVGKAKDFREAKAHLNAAVGRNMCKYCIIFVHTISGKLLIADATNGAMKTIDDLQRELRGQNAPRGSL